MNKKQSRKQNDKLRILTELQAGKILYKLGLLFHVLQILPVLQWWIVK